MVWQTILIQPIQELVDHMVMAFFTHRLNEYTAHMFPWTKPSIFGNFKAILSKIFFNLQLALKI